MIKSVRIKVFLYFTLFLAFFVCFLSFINIKFFDRYFIYRSEAIFYDAYERINDASLDEPNSLDILLKDILGNKYIASMIIEKETLALKKATRVLGREQYVSIYVEKLIRENINEIEEVYLYEVFEFIPQELRYNNAINSDVKVPQEENRVTEIVFIKELDTGDLLLLRKAIHINSDNTRIANEFLLSVGTISILLGSIFLLFFSKRITKPLIELNYIAKSISNLDFSKKFKVKTQDEIGELGNNINLISEELHTAIDDLVELNSDLKEDIERKKEIDEMRKRFISSVSHELKSPIGITRCYVEGLKYNVADTREKKSRYYDVLIDEAEKMEKIAGQLLNLSDLGSKAFALEKSIFNISILINIVVEKFTHILHKKDIKVKVSIEEEYFINADTLKIEQVISNYLSNAINHVDERKYIEIKTELIGKKIRVSVINSGKNIPEKDLHNIWESFYKVDKARSREYGGTGLGLSIVKSIMEHHQEGYGARNREFGVEFWIELNVVESSC